MESKICFISVYENSNNAIRLLSPLLRNNGFRTSEIYFSHWVNNALLWPTAREMELLYRAVEAEKPDVVAVSLRCSAYEQVAGFLTEYLRERYEAIYLWGGLHPTLEPERCLAYADVVIRGEGEIPLQRFMEQVEKKAGFGAVPNLWARETHGGIRNPVSEMAGDLDKLPFRDYSGGGKYYIIQNRMLEGDPLAASPVFDMMMSRGCPFRCSYCYNHVLREIFRDCGRYYRVRSVESAIAELRAAKKRNPELKSVRFDDNIFPFQKDWVDEFCDAYPVEIGLPFDCMLQPRISSRELLSKLRKAGLRSATVGIQSTEKVNRDIYGRKVADSDVLRFSEDSRAEGIIARYQVMIDNPLTGGEDLRELYELMMNLRKPFELYLFSLTNYPGTVMTGLLLEKGMIKPEDVEGPGAKTFAQYRVSLNWKRRPEETFWAAIFVLMTKNFVPRPLVRALAKSRLLKRHPRPLVLFAQSANLVKMGFIAFRMILNGEMNASLLRQWLNFRSLITS